MIKIETERLYLREKTADDFDSLIKFFQISIYDS